MVPITARIKTLRSRVGRSGAWVEIGSQLDRNAHDLHMPRRFRIAEATAEDILLHGLEGTSLKTIARRLSLTTGAIQHYFESKETLLEFTKRQFLSRLLDNAIERYNTASADKLLTLCEMTLPLAPDRMRAWKILVAFSGKVIGDPALTNAQIALYSESVDLFSRAIAAEFEAKGRGKGVDAWSEAVGLISFIEGLSIHMVFSTDGYKSANPLRLVDRYLRHCVGSDAAKECRMPSPAKTKSVSRRAGKP